MKFLRVTTAGESHGKALVVIVEGIPAGLPIGAAAVDHDLGRRMQGYGRGARLQIEQDRIEWLSGVRAGETLGSPIAMLIHNRDWANWEEVMSAEGQPGELRRRRVALPFAVEVLGFSEEEGVRFASGYLGSKAFTGQLCAADLALRDADGVTVWRQHRDVTCPGIFDESGNFRRSIKIRVRVGRKIGNQVTYFFRPVVTAQSSYSLKHRDGSKHIERA